MSDYPKSDYNEYPKTLARDDFWGQVRRTVEGRRISEEELAPIVAAIIRDLDLAAGEDVVLDLACGNGALTSRLYPVCRQVVGVDRSAYLIEVAREHFQREPDYMFLEEDVVAYVCHEPDPLRFTKALCYGSMMFLPADGVATTLAELHDRFSNIKRLLLGNIPDRESAGLFLERNPHISAIDLDDHAAQAGRWWSQSELSGLSARCGWTASFTRMPPGAFNAWYRYDAILTRAK